MLAIAWRQIANDLFFDVKTLVRTTFSFFTRLGQERILGVPADALLHFGVAAGMYLVAARLMSRLKAALLVGCLMVAKELFDLPAKRALLRGQTLPVLTADAVWDLVAGALGLAVGFGIAQALGERWKAPKEPALPELPLRKAREQTRAERVLMWVAVAVCVAIFLGFELAGIFGARAGLFWLVHIGGLAAVWGLAATWGPAAALVVVVPAMPYANWVQRQIARDLLDVSITMVLGLAVYVLADQLRRRLPRQPFRFVDWAVVFYAVYCTAVVTLNCFRFGWTERRAFWLLTPVTSAAVYLLARQLLDTERRVRAASGALAATLCITGVVAVIEFAVSPIRLEYTPGVVFYVAPGLAVHLSYMWPFVFAVALNTRGWLRVVAWAGTLLGIPAMLLTFNRSGWAAAGIAGGVAVVLAMFRRDRVLGAAGLVTAILLAALAVSVIREASVNPGFRSRATQEVASIVSPDSYKRARARHLDVGGRIIARHPLLGRTGGEVDPLSHTLAINYGIPGAVLVGLVMLAAVAASWCATFRTRRQLVYAMTAAGTVAVLGGALCGLGWSALSKPPEQPFVWYMLALVPASVAALRGSPASNAPLTETPAPKPVRSERTVPRTNSKWMARAAKKSVSSRMVMLAVFMICIGMVVVLLWLMFW
jgi:hypothetical protein